MTVIGRLYQKEAAYDGSWWWTTRPDTRGPYYKPVTWEASGKIANVLEFEREQGDEAMEAYLAGLNDRIRMSITSLGTLIVASEAEAAPTVDLAKIRSKKGAVGSTPIEDVVLSLDKIKGNAKKGEALFTQQGCVACHALVAGGPALGPYMGQIGSIMNRDQIAVAILRPNDTISQGFQTAQVKMKDGTVHMGFVTASDADKLVLRDMAGQVTEVKAADVVEEEHLPTSMMPPGLANALSLEEFAHLVAFLAEKKG
jgi:putative heme-binding domain-containing protein